MLIGWHPAGKVIGLWMMPVLFLIEPDVSFELAFVSRAQPRSKRYSLQKRGEETPFWHFVTVHESDATSAF
jgi:hypothetical protein